MIRVCRGTGSPDRAVKVGVRAGRTEAVHRWRDLKGLNPSWRLRIIVTPATAGQQPQPLLLTRTIERKGNVADSHRPLLQRFLSLFASRTTRMENDGSNRRGFCSTILPRTGRPANTCSEGVYRPEPAQNHADTTQKSELPPACRDHNVEQIISGIECCDPITV